jgi:hypothetical protein
MNMKNRMLVAAAALLLSGAGAAFAQNTLAVNNAAALGGTTFGMQISVAAAATNPVFVQSDHPNSETNMRIVWRMKLDQLNAPTTGPGRNFRFMNLIDNDDAANPHKILFLQRQSSGNWRLAVWSRDTGVNGFVFAGGHFLATGGSTNDIKEECVFTMASGGANGVATCTRLEPAGQTFTINTLNDQNRQTDSVQFGFFDFDNFNNVGNVKFDEYESYR